MRRTYVSESWKRILAWVTLKVVTLSRHKVPLQSPSVMYRRHAANRHQTKTCCSSTHNLSHLTQRCPRIIYWIQHCTVLHYNMLCTTLTVKLPSVLWRCWMGGRKGIQTVKNWVVGCWHGCLGWGAPGAVLHIALQMPLPLTISCSSKSRLVLTFLVFIFLEPAHPGGPRQIPEEQ